MNWNVSVLAVVVICLVHWPLAQNAEEEAPTKTPSGQDPLLLRCYGKWGCFSIAEPFLSIYRPVNLFPIHPDIMGVQFLLKTRRNPDVFLKLDPDNNNSFTDSTFLPDRPIKFIIHGYLEHGHQNWIQDTIRELLTKDDDNIISVDWMMGAAPPYAQAVANARMAGAVLAHFITHLRDSYDVSLKDMHLIGHSLGSHVAGYTGKRVPGLGRITGLDPAEPYFQYTDEIVRLDPSDALFVDVIHTDGGSIIIGGLGMIQDCGHVDFYPNGGKRQPGCNHGVIGAIGQEKDLIFGIRRFIGCNHIRAYEFFSESINSDCPFYGYNCDSYANFTIGKCPEGCGVYGDLCAPMGLRAVSWKPFAKPNESAKMFLQTGNHKPFCRHHYYVRLECSGTAEARHHGREEGRLFIRITGAKGQSSILEATKNSINYGPGSSVEFLVSSSDLGQLLRVDVEWRSTATLFNPLTLLRIFKMPKVYINTILIVNLETGDRSVFCGYDEPLNPRNIKTIFAGLNCATPVETS